MTTLTNSCEGGTPTSAVTTGNSGGASGNAFQRVEDDSPVIYSATAFHGSVGIECSGAADAYVGWDSGIGGTSATLWGRAYFRLAAIPASNVNLFRMLSSTNTIMGTIRINSTGAIAQLYATGTLGGTTSATLSVDTWYRVEWQVTAGASNDGSMETRIFAGDDLAPLAVLRVTGVTTGSANPSRARYGVLSNTATVHLDDLALSDEGWIGPSEGMPDGNLLPADASTLEGVDSGDYWPIFGDGGRSTDAALRGVASLYMVSDAGSVFAFTDDILLEIAAQPETEYRVAAYGFTTHAGVEAFMSINWVDENEDTIGSSDLVPDVALTSGTWTLVEMFATSPPGTAGFGFIMGVVTPDTGEIAYFDEIFFGLADDEGESVTGDAALTLPVLTGAIEAAVAVDGQVDAVLPGITAAVEGHVAVDVTGEVTATLPALTGQAVGTVTVTGLAGVTLPALADDAAGTVTVEGALSATLPAATAQIEANAEAVGALDGALPALAATVTGMVGQDVSGELAAVLPALQAQVSGDAHVSATVDATLPAPTGQMSADVAVSGDAAIALPALAAQAEGELTVDASLAATLPALDGQFEAGASVDGSADMDLPALTGQVEASAAAGVTATVTLPALDAQAEGAVSASGSATVTLPAFTGSAQATVTATAGLAATLPALTGSFDAAIAIEGVGGPLTAVLPALDGEAAGTVAVEGSVGATLPALDAGLNGSASTTADFAATLPAVAADIDATAAVVGAAAVTLPELTAQSEASVTVTADLAAALPALTAQMVGEAVDNTVTGGFTATLPALTGTLEASAAVDGALAGALPALTGQITGAHDSVGVLTLTVPALAVTLAGTSGAPPGGDITITAGAPRRGWSASSPASRAWSATAPTR